MATWWRWPAEVQTEHQKEQKGDLSDMAFKHGMIVGTNWAILRIPKSPNLLEVII